MAVDLQQLGRERQSRGERQRENQRVAAREGGAKGNVQEGVQCGVERTVRWTDKRDPRHLSPVGMKNEAAPGCHDYDNHQHPEQRGHWERLHERRRSVVAPPQVLGAIGSPGTRNAPGTMEKGRDVSYWRRTRMISFRVSDTEFELLKAKSEAAGSRNVSDFARLALCGPEARETMPGGDIELLRQEIRVLTASVRQVAQRLEEQRPAQGV
jgi:hypothetical protein